MKESRTESGMLGVHLLQLIQVDRYQTVRQATTVADAGSSSQMTVLKARRSEHRNPISTPPRRRRTPKTLESPDTTH